MDPMFMSHVLTPDAVAKTKRVREAFSGLLSTLLDECGPSGREVALLKTKLEEACMYAVKAISARTENQDPP